MQPEEQRALGRLRFFIASRVTDSLRDQPDLKNSWRSASPRFPWVAVSFADRDLFFCD
jgi:hypothetical protein